MNKQAQGWLIFVAALGVFCTMVAVDIGQIDAWKTALEPKFMGKVIGYFGSVIASFVAGKLIPTGDSK